MAKEGKGAAKPFEYENAVGEWLKSGFGSEVVTKPKFKSTERQANDSCQDSTHQHQAPSSKTSNPDWIVTVPSGDKEVKIVIDAKYYRASNLTAHDLDKLRSDKKSHGADHGGIIVHTDGSGTIPISDKLSAMAFEHGIFILGFTAGRYPHLDQQSKDILRLIAKPELAGKVQEAVKQMDGGEVSKGLGELRRTFLAVAGELLRVCPMATGSVLVSIVGIAAVQRITAGGHLSVIGKSGVLATTSKAAIGAGAGASQTTAAAGSSGAATSASAATGAGAAAAAIAVAAVMMSLAAAKAIGWGISTALQARSYLLEARKVTAVLAQSSKEVDGYGDCIQELQKELDECLRIVPDDAKMKEGDQEASFCAVAELHLLVSERIPTLLQNIQDVAREMGHKTQRLQEQAKEEEKRRDQAREGQASHTTAAVGSGVVSGLGVGLSFLAFFCPPVLAVTIPMAVGGAGAAVGTGIAADQHGKTKVVAKESLENIRNQMDKLKDLQDKCGKLHTQCVDLLRKCLQQIARSKL